jgi:addiction module HigA family antidote
MKKQPVLVPGTVLKEALELYQISVAKLHEDIGLSPSAIRQIVNGKLRISIPIALRLAKYFDKDVQYWIDLQNQYDLSVLEKDAETVEALKKIPKVKKVPPAKPAAEKKAAAGKASDKKTAVKKAGDKKSAVKKGAAEAKEASAGAKKRGRKPKALNAPKTQAE